MHWLESSRAGIERCIHFAQCRLSLCVRNPGVAEQKTTLSPQKLQRERDWASFRRQGRAAPGNVRKNLLQLFKVSRLYEMVIEASIC